MPELPSDHTQRKRVLHPGQSFIVQAPAGSGKTELLVRRYLSLLAVVDAPEKILAITFTKKATAEMRARIINALRRTENNARAETDEQPDAEFRAIAEAALANDRKHDWRITENTRRLRIQTIDSLCSELVRRMPWSARFGSPPEIVDDPAPLYQRAAKAALDHIEDSPAAGRADLSAACQQLLALVDADWGKACDLLVGMLARRDKWIRHFGAVSHAINRADLEAGWQQVVEAELQDAAATIPSQQQTELTALGAFAADNLVNAGKQSPIAALQGVTEFPAAEHQRIEQWHGFAALTLTQAGGLRKIVTTREGFPADKQPEKERMRALLQQLAGQPETVAALVAVSGLPGTKFSDAQWQSLTALMQLLPVAIGELQLLFTEHNQADFIELTQRAEKALGDLGDTGEPDNPSELALALDYMLSHLLMDEFQDTSITHFKLIEKLTAGWQRDDGRTVFLVGDPMQSIYRFREAEVRNFLKVRKSGLGALRPEAITLKTNFRSSPELVAWFNETFREVLPDKDDRVNGAVSYAEAVAYAGATTGNRSEVHVHAAIGRDPQREAEHIAALIEQAQGENANQSIAVLGRARSHLHLIAATLRRRGIPFQALDLEKLADRPAIRDLIALTRVLAQPADRIACLSLLRAPWCGMTLADIAALAAPNETNQARPLPDVWRDEAAISDLSDEGGARLKRLADAMASALYRRQRDGLRQGVEAAWLALGGPAAIAQVNSADLDDCQRYLDLLSEMEAAQIEINAAGLERAVENLWARPGVDARVQLLSIHRAKGLEFDLVFLPGLDRGVRGDEKILLRWQELPEQLLLAPLPSRADQHDPFYKYLERLDRDHAKNETGRLLYVACTRARRGLHLFGGVNTTDGEPKPPIKTSLLNLLWPLVRDEYIAAAQAVETTAQTAPDDAQEFQPQLLQRLPLNWSPPTLLENIPVETVEGPTKNQIEFSWAGETARIVGIVIHQILQQVDDIGWAHWHKQAADKKQTAWWRSQLLENGVPAAHLETALAQVADAIDNTRADPKAAWIFSPDHHAIKTEWPLAGVVDGKVTRIIVDRSFTDENGTRWIVDFKSSRHEGADLAAFLDREQERHQQQMSLYAAVVGRLQPGAIKLGLYFPALRGWREWEG